MQKLLLGLSTIALLAITTAMRADTLLNENFDGLTPQGSATSVGAFSTINGTNVDIVGGPSFYGYLCASPEGGNCIDMDGSYGNPVGQLQSNMQFGPGTYLLSFDLIGNQRGTTSSTTVTFGDYNQTFTLDSGDTTTGIITNQMVTLSDPGYLLFTSNDAAGATTGTLLDNVTVSTVTQATGVTPEPSSLFLLGTGLLGATATLRKRFE